MEISDNPSTLVETFNSSTDNSVDPAYLPISDSNTIDQSSMTVVQQGGVRQADLVAAYQQLQEFRNLNDGWDGYGSKAPTEKTIHNSLRLLDEWDRNLELDVELGVLQDGEVSFELYSSSDSNLVGAIDVFEDGELSFAMSVDGIGDKFGSLHLDSQNDRLQLFTTIKKAIEIL